MIHFFNTATFAFLALFPILNPPAMAPIFLQLTSRLGNAERNRVSALIGFYTFVLLTSLLFVGGWLLKVLGISLPVISVAGGILLFHTAWTMLNRAPKMSDAEREELENYGVENAFFPLTLPVTAGPGSIAITLTLVPNGSLATLPVVLDFLAIAAGIAAASLTVFLFYRFSGHFLRRLGKTVNATISQISAFILLAIGVQIIWGGLRELLKTLN
ncbi:MAG: MarC family protein [Acidobacteria bacterium]|nr:MarC family protein [Acidobacteriota bacterium]